MIHSENLGKLDYSDRNVHCCLNIYKKPENKFNNKENFKLKDVSIVESRLGKNIPDVYDFRIISKGTVGKILSKSDKQYSHEFYIIVNKNNLKDCVFELLKNVNWEKEYLMTSSPNLLQWQVYKYLKDKIHELM